MGKYFDLDLTVIRPVWVLSLLFGGFGILAYLIFAIVAPLETEEATWHE